MLGERTQRQPPATRKSGDSMGLIRFILRLLTGGMLGKKPKKIDKKK
jgi:hypothetical protein